MLQGPEQSQRPSQRMAHLPRMKTVMLQIQVAEQQLEEELRTDDEMEVEPEPAEPDRIEDRGDTDVYLDADEGAELFDPPPTGPVPQLGDLPVRARPLVLYRIDERYEVHGLERSPNKCSQDRTLIAQAVAAHLARCGCKLENLGDWRQIPAIGSDAALLEHVAVANSQAAADELKGRLEKVGRVLKWFAIELPNGDVVTVQALIDAAARSKRATRAAALRTLADAEARGEKPRELAGETWTQRDWSAFQRAQRAAAHAARRGRRKVDSNQA